MKEDEVKEPQVEIREPETEETMSPTGNKLRETKLTQNKGLESDRIGIIVLVILIGMFGIKMLNDLGESLRTPKRRPTTVSTGRTTYPEPIDEIESNDDWMETHSNNYTAPIDPREAQTMQNWQGCARLPTPSGTMATEGPWLRDERDGHIYQIRKFADGQCWMVNNLAYGGDTAQGEPDGCRKLDFNGETTGTPTNVFGAGTYGDCRLPYLDVDTPDDAKFGYLYNWQAAVQTKVAFNGNYYQPPQPTQGICPEGWHLPTGGEDGDLTKLYRLWNNDAQAFYRADLWQPAHAGYSLDDGTYYGAGTTDKYWTSTQKGSSLAYLWNLREHDIDTVDDFYKDYGYSVRCIADASSSRATLVEPEATTVPVVAKTHMVRPDCPGGTIVLRSGGKLCNTGVLRVWTTDGHLAALGWMCGNGNI